MPGSTHLGAATLLTNDLEDQSARQPTAPRDIEVVSRTAFPLTVRCPAGAVTYDSLARQGVHLADAANIVLTVEIVSPGRHVLDRIPKPVE